MRLVMIVMIDRSMEMSDNEGTRHNKKRLDKWYGREMIVSV
jgi:hypothetical protein